VGGVPWDEQKTVDWTLHILMDNDAMGAHVHDFSSDILREADLHASVYRVFDYISSAIDEDDGGEPVTPGYLAGLEGINAHVYHTEDISLCVWVCLRVFPILSYVNQIRCFLCVRKSIPHDIDVSSYVH
jgi:hypothetical protein